MLSRIVAAGIGSIVLTCAALCGTHPAAAAGHAARRTLAGRAEAPPPIFVGGHFVHQPALLEHGHLLVPVRGVFEALHAVVEYTPPRIVVVRKNGAVLAGLVVDRQHAVVNNRPRYLAVAPIRKGGHVYVPLRVIAEMAGASVIYSTHPRLVDIRLLSADVPAVPALPIAVAPPPDTGPPLWAIGSIGVVVAAFAAECLRRVVIVLRSRRTTRRTLPGAQRFAARQIAYTAGLREKHDVGEIGEQPDVNDAVNSA